MAAGQEEEAVASFRTAQRLAPDHGVPYNNLAVSFQKHGRWDEALEYLEEALRLRPNYPDAHRNLGLLQLTLGDFDGAGRGTNGAGNAKSSDRLRLMRRAGTARPSKDAQFCYLRSGTR